MSNKSYPFRAGGFHPPGVSIGPGMNLTEQAVRQYEGKIRPLWGNLDGIPDDISAVAALAEFGVRGDGQNDDGPGLEVASQQPNLLLQLTPGQTYRVDRDITLSGKVLGRGGVIKPTSGTTVTVAGSFEAGRYQCFDTSAGGSVVFGPGIEHVDVSWFGVKGDGVSDDTASLQAAADAAGVSGAVFIPPYMRCRITDTLHITHNYQTWFMDSAEILVDFSGVGVRVGQDAAVRTRGIQLHGGTVRRAGQYDWTPGEIGVQWLNCSIGTYRGFDIIGFHQGLSLLADHGHGTSYITVEPSRIYNCYFGIYIYMQGGSAWANEIGVFGNGSISYSSDSPDATGGAAIYMGRSPDNNFIMNGNKVFGLSVECAKPTNRPRSMYVNACQSSFLSMRFEGFDNPHVKLGPDSVHGGNVFQGGRGLRNPETSIDWSDANRNFKFNGDRGSQLGGGAPDAPLLTLVDSNSVNNVALRVINPLDQTVFEVGSDGKLAVGRNGHEISRILTASREWSPPSLADGESTSVGVTLSGAVPGDLVQVGFSSVSAVSGGGWHLTGQVTGSSNVRVVLTNNTGVTAQLDPGTLRVLVTQV